MPGVRLETIEHNLAQVMPEPNVLALSAVTGDGLERWIGWLEASGPAHRGATAEAMPAHVHS